MGGLYGSEYWTYLLPKRVGPEMALRLTEQCLPLSVGRAKAIGLIDDIIIQDDHGIDAFALFRDQVTRIAEKLAQSEQLDFWLSEKQGVREADEKVKPLEEYRFEELEQMKRNFWGEDLSYHVARSAFVRKHTPGGGLHSFPAPEAVRPKHNGAATKQVGGTAIATNGWSAKRQKNKTGRHTTNSAIDALQPVTAADEAAASSELEVQGKN